MTPFLELVANDLLRTYGERLDQVAVVFPNKRANLFFSEYLARQSGRPLWSPAYLSIAELLGRGSRLRRGDDIGLIVKLYRVYQQVMGKQRETLDDFYFWGEVMLSDFDDIDKNLVDAFQLFVNLGNLKQLESFTFLTEEQREAIRSVFAHFDPERDSELKKRFRSLWDKLFNIYDLYRNTLRELGLGYEGMLYRDSSENLDLASLPCAVYAFVGFTALNGVERRLFDELGQAGRARFYWDYDDYYLRGSHEAGRHLRDNLSRYPNALPADLFDNLSRRKREIRVIASPTENAQARFLSTWAREHLGDNEKENAVVLCSEALLLPVLHSIPATVKHTNITMGFPLSHTPAYTLVDDVCRAALAEADSTAASISERVIAAIEAEATPYRTDLEDTDAYTPLYREALYRCHKTCVRLRDLIRNENLDLRPEVFAKLLRQVLAAGSVPFHGEPAVGLQIMGVLETRNLDFRNLLILSVNEKKMPRGGAKVSLVPYSLRHAFGMNTADAEDAIYAYYFYRLLERAESVTMLYSTASEGVNHGEASRFLLQCSMEWAPDTGQTIRQETLVARQERHTSEPAAIDRTEAHTERLRRWLGAGSHISPSALNTWLNCQLMFYYRYIAGIKESTRLDGLTIDAATFGTLLHKSIQLIYEALRRDEPQGQIGGERLAALLADEDCLSGYVWQAFKEDYLALDRSAAATSAKRDFTTPSALNGTELIHFRIIRTYVGNALRYDLRHAPFTMPQMEIKATATYTLADMTVRAGGSIDRLDCHAGAVRVIDYKTGVPKRTDPRDVAALFIPDNERRGDVFQTFVYADAIAGDPQYREYAIRPSLFYTQKAADEKYEPAIRLGGAFIEDYRPFAAEFRQRMTELFREILDPERPFVPAVAEKYCEYCAYRLLCGR